MKSITIAVILLFSLLNETNAQSPIQLHLETDPMTTIFGARTFSGIIESDRIEHWSVFSNIVTADFPIWMDDLLNPSNKDKGFDSRIKVGGGFGVDYFKAPDKEGLYFGLIALLFNYEVENGSETSSGTTLNLIPRIGHRYYLSGKKNFYLNPFLGVRYEFFPDENISVGGKTFEAAGLQPFGTIHLGFSF